MQRIGVINSVLPAFFGHTFDIITVIPILQGRPVYYTSSLEVVRQLLGNEGKVQLVKPLEITLAGSVSFIVSLQSAYNKC
jgi:hypothetical protein